MNFATRMGLFFCLAVSAYAQISGRWELDVTIALGEDHCILQLSETNGQVEGTYSGILGQDKPVKGTYKHQKLSLSFSGDWPTDGSLAQVTLDGSISGDSGSGNVVIVDRADGTWTAHRAKQADVLPAVDGRPPLCKPPVVSKPIGSLRQRLAGRAWWTESSNR